MQNNDPFVVAIDGVYGLSHGLIERIADELSSKKIGVEIIKPQTPDLSPEFFEPGKDLAIEAGKHQSLCEICSKDQKPELVLVYRLWPGYLAGHHARKELGLCRTCWDQFTTMEFKEDFWKGAEKIIPNLFLYLNGCPDSDMFGPDCLTHYSYICAEKYLRNEEGFLRQNYPDLRVEFIQAELDLESKVIQAIEGSVNNKVLAPSFA